jgi:hypothetical protein
MTVAITRLDVSAPNVREAAARTEDAKAARRMLPISADGRHDCGPLTPALSPDAGGGSFYPAPTGSNERLADQTTCLSVWSWASNLAGSPARRASSENGFACGRSAGPRSSTIKALTC